MRSPDTFEEYPMYPHVRQFEEYDHYRRARREYEPIPLPPSQALALIVFALIVLAVLVSVVTYT
jgi:hypothetical protein